MTQQLFEDHDRRQITRREDDEGKSFASKALWGLLFVLWSVLFAMGGFLATNTVTEMARMRDELNALKTETALTKLNYTNLLLIVERIERKVDSGLELQLKVERRR